jgi:hypothetical protein
MKSKSLTPFDKFTRAVDGLMRVPHSEIRKALEQEKREKAGKKRAKNRPASSSVSVRADGGSD